MESYRHGELGAGPRVPRLVGGGRVCPGNSPLGAWVKSVLEQKEQ